MCPPLHAASRSDLKTTLSFGVFGGSRVGLIYKTNPHFWQKPPAAFAGGGKGLARAAARPALATKSRSIEELADVRSELVVSVRVVIQPRVPLGF